MSGGLLFGMKCLKVTAYRVNPVPFQSVGYNHNIDFCTKYVTFFEQQGKVCRTQGGVVLRQSAEKEIPLMLREDQNSSAVNYDKRLNEINRSAF